MQQLMNSAQQAQQKAVYNNTSSGGSQQSTQAEQAMNNAHQGTPAMQPEFGNASQGSLAQSVTPSLSSTLTSNSPGSQFAVLEVNNLQLQALQSVLHSLQDATSTTFVLQNSNTPGNALLHVIGSTQESIQTACNLVTQLVGNLQ